MRYDNNIAETMGRYLWKTVTVFTTSGGVAGSGFTGVLISVDCNSIRLISTIGTAPGCPLGNRSGGRKLCNNNYGYGAGNFFGSVTVIPIHAIVCFTHNAI